MVEVSLLRRKKGSKEMQADAVKAVGIKGIVECVSLENLYGPTTQNLVYLASEAERKVGKDS